MVVLPSGTVELVGALPRDHISELLAGVLVRSSVYCLSELGAPWGFRVDGVSVAKFHLVLEGTAVLTVEGEEPIQLEPGDLVLLTRGDGHTMQDATGSAVDHLDRILIDHPVDAQARMQYGGTGAPTRLLCGGFGLDAIPEPILPLMPSVIRVDAQAARITGWLPAMFDLLREESTESRPGAHAVFAKLADVFLTQALRSFLIGIEAAGVVPLTPLQDAEIARAVSAMNSDLTRNWTLASIASKVGLSRSAFSQRFTAAVGEPPMRYLSRLRLSRAAGWLTTTTLSIREIAQRCGYDSDESLSKAFKRLYRTTPGAYRASATHAPALAATPT